MTQDMAVVDSNHIDYEVDIMLHSVRSFCAPRVIVCRWGASGAVGEIVSTLGKRALLVTGAKSARESGVLARIQGHLTAAGVSVVVFDRAGHEPTTDLVDEARRTARNEQCDVIVALGGGSVLDLGKATAGLFYSTRTTHDHMASDGEIPERRLPWVALPTTAGSGAEATPNAVLTDVPTGIKKSLRSWNWLADAAIVDPELTLSLPPEVTAYTGMDALTQAIESFTSRGATPLTDGISLEAARIIGENLLPAYLHGEDGQARESMAWGSLMAGIALANARLGAVHGFAHPVGVHCQIPHGMACAILLPWVMEYNFDVAGDKYARLARSLHLVGTSTSTPEAAEALIQFIRKLNRDMGIPAKLAAVGLTKDLIPKIVDETMPSGSLAANPRKATREDLVAILEKNL